MSVALGERAETADRIARRQGREAALAYAVVLVVGLMVAGVTWKRADQPWIGLSGAVLMVVWAAWIVRPRVALALTVFLALVGDIVTVWWFPFNKNLSSQESILYVSPGLTISPLELTLIVALLAVGVRGVAEQRRPFATGALFRPLTIFVLAVAVGWGLGLGSGGDLRVAIFEVRPLLYFPVLYVLTVNVCREPRHHRHLLYSALAAIVLQALLSLRFLATLPAASRNELESLTEHGSSIGMNLLLIVLLAMLAFRESPAVARWALAVGATPVTVVYLYSQRRAAIVALGVAIALFAIILFWRRRRTFWKVVPTIAVVLVGYLGAFWDSETTAGFPAQAVRGVIVGEVTAEDRSSDEYRVIENRNLHATIQSSPVLGLGFGRQFLRPEPLPDISEFEFHEYIPHNSLLWLWIKAGFVGFVAFLYVVARAICLGVVRVRAQAPGADLTVSIGALLFVVMFSIYTYVDIAWEARNSVLFGACLAICASALPSRPSPAAPAETSTVGETINGTIGGTVGATAGA